MRKLKDRKQGPCKYLIFICILTFLQLTYYFLVCNVSGFTAQVGVTELANTAVSLCKAFRYFTNSSTLKSAKTIQDNCVWSRILTHTEIVFTGMVT
jgi:hypothetical protein